MSLQLPPDHPQRHLLAEEVHARPPEAVQAPARATYVALLVEEDARAPELEHVRELCAAFGAAPPPDGTTHFSTVLAPPGREPVQL